MPTVLKYSLNFGLLWGLCIAFSDMMFYVLPFQMEVVNLLKLGVIVFSMYLFLKYFRNKVNSGFLSLPEAIRLGTNTGIAAGVIMGFVTFLLVQYGPQDLIDKMMRDLYTGQKFTAEEQAMVYEGFRSPLLIMMANCFTMAIFGFVTSLLFGFMLRKEKTIFKNKIKE